MTTLFRYITKQLLFTTLLVTAILCMIFWLAKASTLLDFILNRGLDIGFFLYMSMLILPRLLIIILPIATFATLLFGYYRLQSDSEIVVMRAAGTSTYALAKPGLVVGVVIAGFMTVLTTFLLPASYREFKDQEFAIRHEFGSVLLQEGSFNTIAPGVTVFVHKRGADEELQGIMLHDNRDPEKPQTWLAERGAMVATDDGPRAVLLNGNRQQVDRVRGAFSMLLFEQTTLDIAEATGSKVNRWREPRERFLNELFDPQDTKPSETYYADLIAEGHSRLVQPILPLTCAAVTLAILLTGSYSRRGQVLDICKAVFATVIILVISLGMRSLAGKQPIMIYAMYANALLPLVISLYYILVPRKLRASWMSRRALKGVKPDDEEHQPA
jgi:lipopolysaccharide export system permease protein